MVQTRNTEVVLRMQCGEMRMVTSDTSTVPTYMQPRTAMLGGRPTRWHPKQSSPIFHALEQPLQV